jgi:hypothetical protein
MKAYVLSRGNRLGIHEGAICTSQILDEEIVLNFLDHCVMTGGQNILQLDSVVRVSSNSDAARYGDPFALKNDEHPACLAHLDQALTHRAL